MSPVVTAVIVVAGVINIADGTATADVVAIVAVAVIDAGVIAVTDVVGATGERHH